MIIDHLSTNDGLSSGNVMSIIQDSRGYMWFGTEDGLNKFDGYEFTVYRHNPTDSTSISDNWVNSIVEDNNELWIGTRDGLCRYSYQSDNFTQYFHDSKNSNSILNNNINSILKDRKGQIWIGTASGLNLYDRIQDNFAAYSCLPEIDKQNGNPRVNRIALGVKDNILLCTISGLYQFDASKNQFTRYLKDIANINFNTSSIACAFVDTKNNIWIGTESEGLYYFDKALKKLYHFKHNPNDSHSLCYDGISNIMEDNKGNIWISTITGLSYVRHGTKITQAKGIFNNLRQDSKNANGLSLNIVNVTFQDKNDRIWIGGRFGDINILDNQSNKFVNFKFTDIDNRFTSNNMTAMVEDKEGNIWFGADGGGIYFWNRKEDVFKVIRSNFENNASLVITMCLDSYDNLWIGMWQKGIDKLDLKTKTYTHYRYNPADAHSLASDNVFFIREDSKKNIWIGGNFWGLNLYDPVHEYFNLVPNGAKDSSVISGNGIVYIYEDSAKNIWSGSRSNGLNYMNSEEKTFKKYLHNKLDSSSISNNAITCIYEDSHQRLWIGTRGGLNLFNRDNQTFQRFTVSEGLPNDIICRILEDGKGNLWLSTVNGLSQVSANENQNSLGFVFKNFDHSDGLLTNQFNLWSALKTNRGELIFGSIYGVSIFNPDSILDNLVVPPIVFTDFSIFNKPVRIGEPGSPLTKHISETKKITLSHKQSIISFEFAALNYINTEKNEYAYWLEGFENDWKYVGNERKATYTNLDPGKYTFRVKGSNNDGYWNKEGISIVLIITPPWWKTLLFRIFLILFILSMALGFYYHKINLFKKQKKILEDLVKKRTKEVEEKNAVLMIQAEELNESNAVLEERQQFIEEQAEELKIKNEHLQEANEQSLAKQEMIIMQAEDLEVTNTKLMVLNATKDKLFSIIAHDLKNPFSSILSFSEILLTKFQDLAEEKKLKFINAIFDSSKRVYDLLENLLQWARTQTGNIQHNPEAFNLCEVVDSNYDLVKNMLEEKEITFTKNSTENIFVFADRNMINTVIRNLLGNAIKYTEKGTISVDITRNGDKAEVNITDSGNGISEAKLTTIFEIDQGKSTSGTRNEKGSGLGLLICKDFVQINKGEITVKSVVGQGTTFTFTLPLKP